MDVSKLPRMSQTPKPAEEIPVAQTPAATYPAYAVVQPGIGAEVWLSVVIGLVVMLMSWNFARWAVATMSGGTYSTGLTWGAPVPGEPNQHPEGAPIGYWELPGFTALQDTSLFLFGAAMVLEGAVLAVLHRPIRARLPLLVFALFITVLATVLSLIVCIKLFMFGLLPYISLLAVGFGGYIASYEWKLFKQFRRVT